MNLFFDVEHIYNPSIGLEVPLILGYRGQEVQTTGFIDCGAEACVFRNEIGRQLGINVEAGIPKLFGPASGGTIETFGHLIHLEFFGITFESMVYFARYPGLSRNLLGRLGWLNKLRFGLIDYDSRLFLARYD
jgi:hypothetical protein